MRGLLVAPAALALALAGCGGEDRLSKEEFIRRADAICAKYEERFEALEEPRRVADVPDWVEAAIPLARGELRELRELRPPEEDEERIDRMLDEAEKIVPAAERVAEAARDGDEAAAREALEEAERASDRSNEIAREYGLRECGEAD